MPASLQAAAGGLLWAVKTSIYRSLAMICSGLRCFVGMAHPPEIASNFVKCSHIPWYSYFGLGQFSAPHRSPVPERPVMGSHTLERIPNTSASVYSRIRMPIIYIRSCICSRAASPRDDRDVKLNCSSGSPADMPLLARPRFLTHF